MTPRKRLPFVRVSTHAATTYFGWIEGRTRSLLALITVNGDSVFLFTREIASVTPCTRLLVGPYVARPTGVREITTLQLGSGGPS
jgi:hypothetical protein